MSSPSGVVSCLAAAGLTLMLCACAAVLPRQGISDPALADRAMITALPGVRFWGDETPSDPVLEIKRRLPGMPRIAQHATRAGGRPVVEILALSGGGGDGAFGAGLLAGWSARGDRPEFEVVTGVSAGAIIAPFAFLGSRYDRQLEKIWTHYKTSQIVTAQILPGLLGGTALADTGPLKALIDEYVDARLLREIATEYHKGRILLVGTTNLDAQRPVVWNMGEIAASGHQDSVMLFRKVIMASAAIPGAFPPVPIQVRVDGKTYDEMHVDGGTTREVFASPVNAPFKAFDALYSKPPIRKIYIVKNGKIVPEQQVVTPQTIPIAARAISTLIKSQNTGELYRIYRMAEDAEATFNFIAVPAAFNVKSKEFFDPYYQTALFRYGYELGERGVPWQHSPSGFVGGGPAPDAHEQVTANR